MLLDAANGVLNCGVYGGRRLEAAPFPWGANGYRLDTPILRRKRGTRIASCAVLRSDGQVRAPTGRQFTQRRAQPWDDDHNRLIFRANGPTILLQTNDWPVGPIENNRGQVSASRGSALRWVNVSAFGAKTTAAYATFHDVSISSIHAPRLPASNFPAAGHCGRPSRWPMARGRQFLHPHSPSSSSADRNEYMPESCSVVPFSI